MQQTFKQRQRTKPPEEEVELSVPCAPLADTTDAAELVADINKLLEA